MLHLGTIIRIFVFTYVKSGHSPKKKKKLRSESKIKIEKGH